MEYFGTCNVHGSARLIDKAEMFANAASDVSDRFIAGISFHMAAEFCTSKLVAFTLVCERMVGRGCGEASKAASETNSHHTRRTRKSRHIFVDQGRDLSLPIYRVN